MVTRRDLLTASAAGSLLALFFPGRAAARRSVPALDPGSIPKYVTPLPIPGTMPLLRRRQGVDEYRIAVRQFRQQILPAPLPPTTVWGFGSIGHPETFHSPSPTIEARVRHPVRVTWINQLVDRRGRYLPHLLPVDQTLHWANPPGGLAGRDSTPFFTATPGPYTGPVPLVIHLHGGHSTEESDGYPEAWYLPVARDIPRHFAKVGSWYERFRRVSRECYGVDWAPGTATFTYANDQPAGTLWYHDHALGLTRANVYAGPAGFYLLRGGGKDLPLGVLPGPARGRRPGFADSYEIPLAIQDRSFGADGRLRYPDSRAFSDGYPGPYRPLTDVPPIWNPEFFGDTIVVNGATWPELRVEQRRYRFRLLNGANSRHFVLAIAANPTARPARAVLPIWQIGSDGGFLPEPVRREQVSLGNAQRVDAVVDFTDVPVGTQLYLVNEGPDGPFGGGAPGVDFEPADPSTTGQVLKFVVVPRTGVDRSVPPEQLRLPAVPPGRPATRTRRLALLEEDSSVVDVGPVAALLGTVDEQGTALPHRWKDLVSETPQVGVPEIWELDNRTADAHPIHVHQVQFRLVGRGAAGGVPPQPWERGPMDTVVALPGEVTRIEASFDLPGRYVWHCHILEHEDNEMMRPVQVGYRRTR